MVQALTFASANFSRVFLQLQTLENVSALGAQSIERLEVVRIQGADTSRVTPLQLLFWWLNFAEILTGVP